MIKGIPEMITKIARIAAKLPGEIEKALYQEAQIEMTESKRRVPVDTGTLRASGYVDRTVRRGRDISVTLGYGGEAEGYALVVHEDLQALHKVGQAKYLESVLKESGPHMARRVARRIDLNLIARSS